MPDILHTVVWFGLVWLHSSAGGREAAAGRWEGRRSDGAATATDLEVTTNILHRQAGLMQYTVIPDTRLTINTRLFEEFAARAGNAWLFSLQTFLGLPDVIPA